MTDSKTTKIERDCLVIAADDFKRAFARVLDKPMPNALLALSESAQKYQESWIDLMAAERIFP
jgi:hypothetical protein